MSEHKRDKSAPDEVETSSATETNAGVWRRISGFWRRLSNQQISLFFGFVSLLIAALGLINALNAKDVKNAVENLSNLASQTKRQADFTKDQLDQVRREADIVAGQLQEMRTQTNAFQNTATAAQGQLREMQHEQGAVVTVAGISFIENRSGKTSTWTIAVNFQNSGNSPTQNLTVYSRIGQIWAPPFIQIGPINPRKLPTLPPDPMELVHATGIAPQRVPLGPHIITPLTSVTVFDEQLRQSVAASDGGITYLNGVAIYDDNLNARNKHYLKFCYTFRIATISNFEMKDGQTSVGEIKPTPHPCPFWNCADNECKVDKHLYDEKIAAETAAAKFKGTQASVPAQPVRLPVSGIPSLPLPPTSPPPIRTFIVFFDNNIWSLTEAAKAVVTEAVRTAKANNFVRVQIVGHTDTVGSDDDAKVLSTNRAKSVKDEMVRQGVSTSSITVEGRGYHDLLVPTALGVHEPQNNRAVIDLSPPP